jgi:amino acid transporter
LAEIKDPQKRLFQGNFLWDAVLILYVLIQTVSSGVLGDQLSENKDPIGGSGEHCFGPPIYRIVMVSAGVSMFGMLMEKY